ncbi:MAG: DUF5659 domain-containing protein [bacterium]
MTQDKNNSLREIDRIIPLDDSSLVWTSFDLGASAALVCADFELLTLDKTNPRKAMFVFKREDGIEGKIDDYWADRLEVKARTYFDTLKMLKNRLYSE